MKYNKYVYNIIFMEKYYKILVTGVLQNMSVTLFGAQLFKSE